MSSLSEPRRPRLLAQNRKLRHLKGLSLRNLSFAPTQLRSADDADINRTSRKLEVLNESGSLHPSRSSENLRPGPTPSLRRDSIHDATPKTRPPQLRRTSLSMAHSNPGVRQKKLEDLMDTSAGDVFFTIHVASEPEPVYISEVRERSANFNFQFFDISNQGPAVARSCRAIFRIWAKRPKQAAWIFLLEELIDLRDLKFIGTLMGRQFPPNALVFHLEDGLYSLDLPSKVSEPRQSLSLPTSSYHAIMKLSNLENSIEDAIQTRRTIMQQINDIIEAESTEKADLAQEEVSLANSYLVSQRRMNRQTEKRRDSLIESLKTRREAIVKGRQTQAEREKDIANNREKLASARDLVDQMEQQIRGQRRRICSELIEIFPITPIPNAPPLSFQICNIPLSNSIYDSATARTLGEDAISASLGLVALLTRHLQFYLSHPLPYEISHLGSRSYIKDEISHLPDKQVGRREFPLFLPRGGSTTGQWRFEYGWFLLNKNIEALCSSQGLRVVDIRHSLPNLKYLLYVCSAGTDEMPERKKGGVRGLWAGRLKGRVPGLSQPLESTDGDSSSATGSRPGSADSEAHTLRGDALRSAVLDGKNGSLGWSAANDSAAPDLPFSDTGSTFTLRTKGLRENVAG